MFPAKFKYFAPHSLAEALELLTQHGDDAKLLAGGQSLLPAMKLRLAEPACLIDLGQLHDLAGIRLDGESLVLGAMTVHADVASSDLVRSHLPGLAEAASVIADVQVRNRGTIGGSVAHADPGADFPVILTALDASIVSESPSGSRTTRATNFFLEMFTTALASDEIITEIRVPLSPLHSGTAYVKFEHPASHYVVISAGVRLVSETPGSCSFARVAIGGLAGHPIRATATEQAIEGQLLTTAAIVAAAQRASEGTDPDDDMFASQDYKRQLATVCARRAIEAALSRTQAGGAN